MQTEAELDDAAVGRIRIICAGLPETEEDRLQDRPLFHVRRRRFAIFNGLTAPARPRWQGCGRSLHLLADPLELDGLLADSRFSLSVHHGHLGWVSLSVDDPDWDEVAELLRAAHHRAIPRSMRQG